MSRADHCSIRCALKWKETHPQPNGKTGKGSEQSFQKRRQSEREIHSLPLSSWKEGTPAVGNTAGHVLQPSLGRMGARAHVPTRGPWEGAGLTSLPLPRVPRRWRCRSAPAPGGRSPSAGPGASGRPARTAPPAREAGRRGGLGRVPTPDVTWLFSLTPDPELLLDVASGSDPDPVITSAPGLTWEGSCVGAGGVGSWATYRRAQPKPTSPEVETDAAGRVPPPSCGAGRAAVSRRPLRSHHGPRPAARAEDP